MNSTFLNVGGEFEFRWRNIDLIVSITNIDGLVFSQRKVFFDDRVQSIWYQDWSSVWNKKTTILKQLAQFATVVGID